LEIPLEASGKKILDLMPNSFMRAMNLFEGGTRMIDPVTMSRIKEAWKQATFSASIQFPDMFSATSSLRLVREVQAKLGISKAEAAAVIFKIAAKEFELKYP
jgi:hypothetical protein